MTSNTTYLYGNYPNNSMDNILKQYDHEKIERMYQMELKLDDIVEKYARFNEHHDIVTNTTIHTARINALFELRAGGYRSSEYTCKMDYTHEFLAMLDREIDFRKRLLSELKHGLRMILLSGRIESHDWENTKVWYVSDIVDQENVLGMTLQNITVKAEPDVVFKMSELDYNYKMLYNKEWE